MPVRISLAARTCAGIAGALLVPVVAAAQAPAGDLVDGLPVYRGIQELRIGEAAGTDGAFAHVAAVRVGTDGRIYVLDDAAAHVRVFDPDGRPLGSIGRRGTEPGELQFPGDLGVLGDTVWISDPANGQLALFDTTGEFLGRVGLEGPVSMHGNATIIALQPATLRPDGTFESAPSVISRLGSAQPDTRDSVRVARIRFDAGGQVLDTIGWTTVHLNPSAAPPLAVLVGWRAIEMPDPFAAPPLRVEHDGVRYTLERPPASTGDDAYFSITREPGHDDDDATTRTYRYRPVPVDPGIAVAMASALADRVQMPNTSREEVEAAIREGLAVPPFQFPVGRMLATEDGGLWLLRGDAAPGLLRWTILDAAGDPVGDAVVPADLTPHVIAGDLVWGLVKDPDHATSVVRYRLQGNW